MYMSNWRHAILSSTRRYYDNFMFQFHILPGTLAFLIVVSCLNPKDPLEFAVDISQYVGQSKNNDSTRGLEL